jgi:hypothetical protein
VSGDVKMILTLLFLLWYSHFWMSQESNREKIGNDLSQVKKGNTYKADQSLHLLLEELSL